MKIALIAPPHTAVPPANYGGTELFVRRLAEGLQKAGAQVIVYANAQSTVNVERRSLYEQLRWRNARQMVERASNLDLNTTKVRHYVEEDFSIDRMVKNYLELYEGALGESRTQKVA